MFCLRHFQLPGLLVLLTLAAPRAHAQFTFIWDGNGGSNDWSNPGNWTVNAAPPSHQNTIIVFAGAVGLTPNQNIANPFLLNVLTFSPTAGTFDLSGSALDFRSTTGAVLPTIVQNSATAVIIRNNLVLTNNLTYSGIGSADLRGEISGAGGLTKAGSGTLTLSSFANNYGGPTIVSGGTLQMNITNALPATTAVTVSSGAILDLNGFITAVGSLAGAGGVTLGGGILAVGDAASTTFSGVISGTGALNKLGTGTLTLSNTNHSYTGGTFVSAGTLKMGVNTALPNATALTVNASGTLELDGYDTTIGSLTGAGIVQTTAFGLTPIFTVGRDDTSTTFSGVMTGSLHLFKEGTGVLTLSNTNNDYSSTTVVAGTLRMGAVTALPATTALTVNSGTTLDLNGFDTTVGRLSGTGAVTTGGAILTVNGNTTSTFSGSVSGTGGLARDGSSSLTLSGTNTYTGATTVNAGALILTGQSTSSLTTVNAGTFRIDGGTLTMPSFGSVTVNSGAAAEYTNGATINGGILRGPGTHTLLAGATLNGVTTLSSTIINQTGTASVTNFSNGGAFTVNAGQTLTWSGGTNTSSGRLTVNGTANVNDFVSDGLLTVPNGGLINNTVSNMVLGGGSTTFVGAVGNLGGKIDLGGQQLHVRGGLLVTNAGSFGSGNGVRNGTTIADYGALVKGTGPYQSVITQNGGQYLPGNSPGTSQVGDFFINGGGNLIFQITDAGPSLSFPTAPGIAGMNPGWGLTQVFTSMNFTATPASPYTITMQTQLPPPAAPDTPGPMSSFDPNRAYQWLIFDLQPGAAFNGTFDPNAINFATAQFVNSTMGGTFSLARTGGQIFLTFTPVPEPIGIIAVAFGGIVIVRAIRRRRRSSPFCPD